MKEKKCEICGYSLVLDEHHWSKQETSWLCPNCHHIYERVVRWTGAHTHRVYNTYTSKEGIIYIKKYLNEFNNKKIQKKFEERLQWLLIDMIKNRTFWRNAKYFECEKSQLLNFFSILIDDIRGCEVCLLNITTDTHHFGPKDFDGSRKFIRLCPNHHAIVHRILKDKNGTKFNSKEEIIENIRKVEGGLKDDL